MTRLAMLELLRELRCNARSRTENSGSIWPAHELAMDTEICLAIDSERKFISNNVDTGKLFRDAHKTSGELASAS